MWGMSLLFIIYRLKKQEPGCHIFNYADKPDFNMIELVSIIEKANARVLKIKIPYCWDINWLYL